MDLFLGGDNSIRRMIPILELVLGSCARGTLFMLTCCLAKMISATKCLKATRSSQSNFIDSLDVGVRLSIRNLVCRYIDDSCTSSSLIKSKTHVRYVVLSGWRGSV